jgi:membrane protein implicated in regulation of membrane protease activity
VVPLALQEQLDAQTGSPLVEILAGNVPLGNPDTTGAWSLLSLILSVLGVLIALVLLLTMIRRRRRREKDVEQGERQDVEQAAWRGVHENAQKGAEKDRHCRLRFLKLVAALVGVLVAVLFLLFDDMRLPMVWINCWTPLIAVVFLVHMALLILQVVVKKRGNDDDNNNSNDEGEAQGAYDS